MCESDEAFAKKRIQASAAEGDARATKASGVESVEVTRDAADGGLGADASEDALDSTYAGYQFANGTWYLKGEKIECDPAIAVRELKMDADGGNATAMINLGRWYSWTNRHVAANLERALEFFLRAAQTGMALGYLLAGRLYQAFGDNEWAARCYREASARGSKSADRAYAQLLSQHPMLQLKLA